MQPTTDWTREPIGIAGGGRVGQAIGRMLQQNGEPVVCVASRTPRHAKAAAVFIGPQVEPVSYAEMSSRASRLLISVPDDALEDVAGLLRAESGVALHTCGAAGSGALQALRSRGVSCGTLHPLQTIPSAAGGAASLNGIAFAVSGDDAAVAWAAQIAAFAKGTVLRIPDALRPLYHAAAVMASNYVIALLSAAQTLMEEAGVAPRDALNALAPIVRASVGNALDRGPTEALTGPIQRGDIRTVAAHLSALHSAPIPVQVLYRAAARQTLQIAR
ncbi:MAG: Rossmann-like and DUF2520 domain-containing protein, partial [Bryobacteraceae bacterium]